MRYIEPAAVELLRRNPWHVNIRELENAVERALLLSDGISLKPEDFPATAGTNGRPVMKSLHEVEGEAIRRALSEAHGNIVKAAEVLDIGRNTLYEKIRKHGIKLEGMRENE